MKKTIIGLTLLVTIMMSFFGMIVKAEDVEDPKVIVKDPKPPVVVIVPLEDVEDPK